MVLKFLLYCEINMLYLQERLGAARLLASLLTSADDVITEVSPFLSEALAVLEGISRMDSSPILQETVYHIRKTDRLWK